MARLAHALHGPLLVVDDAAYFRGQQYMHLSCVPLYPCLQATSHVQPAVGVSERVRATWISVKRRKIVAVLPMLLLFALLTAGIVVVEIEADRDREAVRDKTAVQADILLKQLSRWVAQ